MKRKNTKIKKKINNQLQLMNKKINIAKNHNREIKLTNMTRRRKKKRGRMRWMGLT